MSTRGKRLGIQSKFSYSKIGITFLEPLKFYATTNRILIHLMDPQRPTAFKGRYGKKGLIIFALML